MSAEMSSRDRLLLDVASRIPRGAGSEVVLVAIDGADGAGKTWFADELARVLRAGERQVIRASADDFHHSRAIRYRQGMTSGEGYWLDAFNYAALRADLLDPLRPGGTRRYRPAGHDLASDRELDLEWSAAPPGAVLVLDGVFLHRAELRDYWTYSVYLEVETSVRLARMAARDGGPELRQDRYLEAQRIYRTSCRPHTRASLVIDNTDLQRPVISQRRAPRPDPEAVRQ